MSFSSTKNLVRLIHSKRQILTQLLEIGSRQEQCINEAATNNLLHLLGAKQHLIGALQIVERGLRSYQVENPAERKWRTEGERDQCAVEAEECRVLLAQVMELEKTQEARMIGRRDEVAARLQHAASSRQAAGAYAEQRGHCSPVAVSGSHTGTSRSKMEPSIDLTSEASQTPNRP